MTFTDTPAEKRLERDTNLALLPPIAYGHHPTDNSVILHKRGERGYFPQHELTLAGITAAALNAVIGVTPAQAEAMACGAAFGWHVPAANPETWETA